MMVDVCGGDLNLELIQRQVSPPPSTMSSKQNSVPPSSIPMRSAKPSAASSQLNALQITEETASRSMVYLFSNILDTSGFDSAEKGTLDLLERASVECWCLAYVSLILGC